MAKIEIPIYLDEESKKLLQDANELNREICDLGSEIKRLRWTSYTAAAFAVTALFLSVFT